MSVVKPGLLDDVVSDPVLKTADGVVIAAGSIVYFWALDVFREVVVEAVRGGVVWERVSEQLSLVPDHVYSNLDACARARGWAAADPVPVRLEWARRILDLYRAPKSMQVTRLGNRFTLHWPVGWGMKRAKDLGELPADAVGDRAKLVEWLYAVLGDANRQRFKF